MSNVNTILHVLLVKRMLFEKQSGSNRNWTVHTIQKNATEMKDLVSMLTEQAQRMCDRCAGRFAIREASIELPKKLVCTSCKID